MFRSGSIREPAGRGEGTTGSWPAAGRDHRMLAVGVH